MKNDSKPEPINDEHKAFAEELVVLARKHGTNHLKVEFSLTGGRRFFEGQYDSTQVRFDWLEGRHGAKSSYSLRAEAYIRCSEGGGES